MLLIVPAVPLVVVVVVPVILWVVGVLRLRVLLIGPRVLGGIVLDWEVALGWRNVVAD